MHASSARMFNRMIHQLERDAFASPILNHADAGNVGLAGNMIVAIRGHQSDKSVSRPCFKSYSIADDFLSILPDFHAITQWGREFGITRD